MSDSEIEALAMRVLESDALKDHESSRELLIHLQRHSTGQATGQGWSRRNLARALKKKNPAIGVAVSKLRSLMDAYFNETLEGVESDTRLTVSKAPYRLQVALNVPHDFGIRFWRHYLPNDSRAVILCGLPIFLYSQEQRCFYRFLDLNGDSTDQNLILERAEGALGDQHVIVQSLRQHKLRPSFHYLSLGDSLSITYLRRWFRGQRRKDEVEVKFSRKCTHGDVSNANAICVGSHRVNWSIERFQRGQRLEVRRDGVGEHGCEETKHRDDEQQKDGKIFVLVTRIINPESERRSRVTAIAGNNGLAIAKVVRHLTQEAELKSIWKFMQLGPKDLLPAEFQILFEVHMEDEEPQTVRIAEYIPVGSAEPKVA